MSYVARFMRSSEISLRVLSVWRVDRRLFITRNLVMKNEASAAGAFSEISFGLCFGSIAALKESRQFEKLLEPVSQLESL